jgi:hypothetical protein
MKTVFLPTFVLFTLQLSQSVLDVSPGAADEIISNLQSHIFVDRRHIAKVSEEKVCDSLSGPNCAVHSSLAAGGVIPEAYIPGIKIDFSILHKALPIHLWAFNYTSALPDNYALPSPSSLVLSGPPEGGKITSHYSMVLPTGRGVAKLEGRWLIEDSVSIETLLPAYISFSEPVLVGRLWAELSLPSDIDPTAKPAVIVAFRLGKETVWSTEAIMDQGFTMDLTLRGSDGHGPLRACDQIVIFSTVKGLKVVSIEFENIKSQVLVPVVLLVPGKDGNLVFRTEQVDATAIASRQVVSIKEAVENGYKVEFPKTAGDRAANLAELVARDIGMIVPIDEVYQAVRSGEISVPHELRKAILKHEKEIKRITKLIAERALQGALTPLADEPPSSKEIRTEKLTEEEKRIQSISDLFIAALMHL